MPRQKHSYTQYITVLNEKSNNYNYFALCYYCKTKFTNTKRLVISHLKSCKKFAEHHTEDERNRILYPGKCEENDQTERETSFSSPLLSHGTIIFFCDLLNELFGI